MAIEVKKKTSRAAATAICLVSWSLIMIHNVSLAERVLKDQKPENFLVKGKQGVMINVVDFFWKNGESSNERVWPEMKFGWRIVVGSIVGFFGAALGSIGGVGGGGIFIPMLTLIIGFDAKSSTAISKCMIMGAAGSTVYYNMRLRHPTLDLPVIDYDLALLFQPMLMLGISIGVAFNVMFADWMVTVLLIILFIGTSTKALFKGIDTWKKETNMKKEAAEMLESDSTPGYASEEDYKSLPSGSADPRDEEVPLLKNIYWKELLVLVYVWVAFLVVQIIKVASATSTFAMVFSSSMSVVQYYLLERFPVPYAAYFVLIATIAALTGQHVVRKIIAIFGRASIIIFVLAFTIFVSAICLGGVGIENMVEKMENEEYMGFENICHQS
ncbi:sulfite exporter TauE/SafE family protein 3-like isoform X3 [Abrus precatorius]|uniref:Sulfite exporter TauE/SafE family protein 3-like isoform X3 n=1 Tax=Abrus precatorius TaxID=3816 RepID=A0A8B8KR15_ABRPR|nr:sulfite exporter TauE/SafE family protein 3-like isoform X3 [Abrus precatorius]